MAFLADDRYASRSARREPRPGVLIILATAFLHGPWQSPNTFLHVYSIEVRRVLLSIVFRRKEEFNQGWVIAYEHRIRVADF